MKLEDYPHLVEMKEKMKTLNRDSKSYWQYRCTMLEKSLDETYSKFERDNCFEFWRILANK